MSKSATIVPFQPSKSSALMRTKSDSESGVKVVSIDERFINELRERLRSGEEKHSSNRPAYRDSAQTDLIIRTSSKAITFAARIRNPFTQMTSTHSLKMGVEIADGKPVTSQFIKDVTNKLADLRKEYGEITEGDAEDAAEIDNHENLPIEELFEIYKTLPEFQRLRPATQKGIEKTLRRHLIGFKYKGTTFGKLTLSQIGKVAAQRWLDALEGGTSPTILKSVKGPANATARLCRQYARRMFTALKNRSYITRNPIAETVKIEANDPRKTKLTPDQLRQLWEASEKLPPLSKDYLQMMILTAQRERQLSILEWDWVDLENRLITFPPEAVKQRNKGAVEFEMPISEPVAAILIRRRSAQKHVECEAQRDSKYVFASRNGFPISNFSRIAARVDSFLCNEKHDWKSKSRGNPPFKWSFHDLRRTAAELLEKADDSILPAHVKAVLAHRLVASNDAVKNYTTAKMQKMKAHLFDLLADNVMIAVNPPTEEQLKEIKKARALAALKRDGITLDDLA